MYPALYSQGNIKIAILVQPVILNKETLIVEVNNSDTFFSSIAID